MDKLGGLSRKPNIYVSWSTSELRVRLAPWNRFKPSSIFYWQFQGGTSFVGHSCYFGLVLVMFSRLFIAALWSPAGKGLTSWRWFVMFYCAFVTFPCGILGQVWYLIVSIPDLCHLSYLTTEGCLLSCSMIHWIEALTRDGSRLTCNLIYLIEALYTEGSPLSWNLIHWIEALSPENNMLRCNMIHQIADVSGYMIHLFVVLST